MDIRNFELQGKIGLIIGASRGLGRQIAGTLANVGVNLVIVSRSMDKLQAEAKSISKETGVKVHPLSVDISQWKEVEELRDRVMEIFSRIDILVNVAGVQIRKPTVDFTLEEWEKVININMRGTFRSCQLFGEVMIAQGGGKIINIASLNSVVSLPERVPYYMTKAGVVALTKALAIEWAEHNIRVNAISPGYFKTEMTAPLFKRKAWTERLMQEIPLQRIGVPADLDGLVILLASEASNYITGQNFFVDGGFTAGEIL